MQHTEYDKLLERYERLEKLVDERLKKVLDTDNNPLIQITHRIKTKESIEGKLKRKPDHYKSVDDLYDVLGVRVICYFSSDVDKATELIAGSFKVDKERSKDKRKLINATSFGYLSLHYVCSLPDEDSDLSDLWFEIQIKTILQHSWAEIEHDLGYKSEIEIPRDIRRSFSKAAGLLETADDIFSDIQKRLEEYKIKIKREMDSEALDELYFDRLTLIEFTAHNRKYRDFLGEIAAITHAHITEGNPDNQLKQIEFLGINTLGDMTRLIDEQHDVALSLAQQALIDSELDELSSTAGYYYLFRAKLVTGGCSSERIKEFFAITMKDEKRIEYNTEKIMKEREIRFGKKD